MNINGLPSSSSFGSILMNEIVIKFVTMCACNEKQNILAGAYKKYVPVWSYPSIFPSIAHMLFSKHGKNKQAFTSALAYGKYELFFLQFLSPSEAHRQDDNLFWIWAESVLAESTSFGSLPEQDKICGALNIPAGTFKMRGRNNS